MRSESVIGRHFIQIFSRVIITLIMHVHLPNCSKHSSHESSIQRNRLIHLVLLLSGALTISWAESCLKRPTRLSFKRFPLCSSL